MTAEREAMTLEQVRTRLRDLVRQAPDEMDSVIVPIRELIGFAHAIDAALSRAAEPVGDEMVRLALDARCGSWSVRQLFQDEDEAPEIMRSALAAALFGIGVPVAWQIRAPKGGRDWEPCTRADYEATLRTGRYMGFPEGTKFVETRALYTRPLEPADAKDAARYRKVRQAYKALKLYVFDDPNDPFSGDWMYGPKPEDVDAFVDGLNDDGGIAAMVQEPDHD